MKTHPNDAANIEAAMKWWNSLLNGKKRYLKEHCKLTQEHHIVNYWLAHVKQQAQQVFMEGANHAN